METLKITGVERYCLLVCIFLKTIVTKEKNTPYSRIIITVMNKSYCRHRHLVQKIVELKKRLSSLTRKPEDDIFYVKKMRITAN